MDKKKEKEKWDFEKEREKERKKKIGIHKVIKKGINQKRKYQGEIERKMKDWGE